MLTQLHTYLHEYDFLYHDYISSNFKKEILDSYYQNLSLKTGSLDFPFANDKLNNFILPKLNKIVQNHYWVGDKLYESPLRIYIQNNKESISRYHNHSGGMCALSGVFYLDPPKEGGEILFLFELDEQPFKLKPQKDKLYLFPMWVYHTPTKQQDPEPRICFNWNYASNIRPIDKAYGTQW